MKQSTYLGNECDTWDLLQHKFSVFFTLIRKILWKLRIKLEMRYWHLIAKFFDIYETLPWQQALTSLGVPVFLFLFSSSDIFFYQSLVFSEIPALIKVRTSKVSC